MSTNKPNLHDKRCLAIVLIMLCGLMASCGSTKMQYGVFLDASNSCNLSEMGQPVPVTVRIYTLQDRSRFEQATFQELWKTDYEFLGKDLLHRQDIT